MKEELDFPRDGDRNCIQVDIALVQFQACFTLQKHRQPWRQCASADNCPAWSRSPASRWRRQQRQPAVMDNVDHCDRFGLFGMKGQRREIESVNSLCP